MMNKATLFLYIFLCCILLPIDVFGQQGNGGTLSGNLETQGNFYIRDAEIGAANIPQYDNQLYGANTWINLTYNNWGFDFGLRFDAFQHSQLPNPLDSYTDEGIGRWYIRKELDKLDITAGYIYDQLGSGIIFRSYEARALFIDNALLGLRLAYDIAPDWEIKVFSGRQKFRFDTYGSVVRGLGVEGFITGKEGSNWSLAPGIGVVGRTHSEETIDQLLATIATYTPQDTVSVDYNSYALTAFNTLSAGPWSWYVEGAYKTNEVFFDPFADKLNWDGQIAQGKFVRRAGSVLYSSLSYAANGLGISFEAKRTANFSFRTNPFVALNQGMINFLPPMSRENTYRLTTRYVPATQEIGEMALQADVRYSPSKSVSLNANLSNITNLNNELLYQELYTEIAYKYKRKWTLLGGVQVQNYNQDVFEEKPGVPNVQTIIPYVDFLYKIDRKKAIRFEAQTMFVGQDTKAGFKQDYGDWVFGLVEYTMAPHWTFTVSDMYNMTPGKNAPDDGNGGKKAIHYPRFDIFYSRKANRFSLSFIKQVEGVVCSGGICRLEPAFSGVRLGVNAAF